MVQACQLYVGNMMTGSRKDTPLSIQGLPSMASSTASFPSHHQQVKLAMLGKATLCEHGHLYAAEGNQIVISKLV